jgi:transcription antitermination factor NusG
MSWYALIVAEDSELKVVKRLGKLGMTAFVPTEFVIAACLRTGVRQETPAPMIDGYVFARDPDWDVIRKRIPQVFGPVRRDGRPAVLNGDDVDRMRLLTRCAMQSRHGIKPGDEVRITRGALRDLRTVVQAIKGQLATITMTALGKDHTVQVNINMVDAA